MMGVSEEAGGAEDLLAVDGLSVGFPRDRLIASAVDGLSFRLGKGETLAIVGESGSGKSVTALSLMRLVEYGGGVIGAGALRFRRRDGTGVDLAALSEATMAAVRGNEISMIFQEPMTSLNPVFTIGDQIAETVRLHRGISRKAARAEALHMLEAVRIPDAKRRLGQFPHQLSGGMRQRAMIAMALVCRPSLLIADEPTTALDVTIQAQVLRLIRSLQRELGMSIIFITHDMGVVAEVADRVLVMYRGRKVEEGRTDAVFAAPQHPYTRALLSAVPRLGGMRGKPRPERFPLVRPEGAAAAQSTQEQPVPDQLAPRLDAAAPLLRVRDLTTRFDLRTGIFGRVSARIHAVEGVSFELLPGETLGLVGESGCGKSTVGRSILRLVDPQSGTIEFAANDVTSLRGGPLRRLRREMQLVFQDPFASLNPHLAIGFSIAEPLIEHGCDSGSALDDRVAALLRQVGMPNDCGKRFPHEFSGGQRQRICIARALALDPKLVIADEAVSALDVTIQAQIVNLLMDLQEALGLSYLFISHDMAVIERICHRVAVMYLGQIVEIGPRAAVFENPQHAYTKRLMAAIPVADPLQRERARELVSGEIPSPIRAVGDEPARVRLREVAAGHFVAIEPQDGLAPSLH